MGTAHNFKHMNICAEMETGEMIAHLRRWADFEEKCGARYRANQWRIVANRIAEMSSASNVPPQDTSQ
jgi:hypothetical protein